MAQGAMSTKSGGRRLPTNAAKLQGGDVEDVLDVPEWGTTTCSGNLVLADGTVGGDARKVADGARYKTGSG